MNNLLPQLKTNFPKIWARFEEFLEKSYPGQKVIVRLELLSLDIQLAMLTCFLLSSKPNYPTNNILKSDWDYLFKKLNHRKMGYTKNNQEFTHQQREAIKIMVNIFGTLNSHIAELVEQDKF